MRFQIYELYELLLYHDIDVSESVITKIGKDYSEFERDIFVLYSHFSRLINAIHKGKHDEIFGDIIIDNKNYNTVRERVKGIIDNIIDKLDVILLDDFFIFDEILMYMMQYALNQGKEIYLTVKYNGGENYLLDVVYPVLFKRLNQEYVVPAYKKKIIETTTALQFIQGVFCELSKGVPDNSFRFDKSVQIVKPFPSREMEFRYIVECIVRILRENCGIDSEKLLSALKNDIAITLGH